MMPTSVASAQGASRGEAQPVRHPLWRRFETTDQRCPVRIKLSVVKGFRSNAIKSWSQQHLTEGSIVITDGLACFNAVVDAGCLHDKIVCGGGRASVEEPEFYWVNTILGNLKSALRSTYHAIRPRYAQRYLSELQYRFNRRSDLSGVIVKSGV